MSDLAVTPISDALADKRIDLIATGSIAAVESVRLIRSLRRLGATVQPWLSPGAAQFITPTALEWAANHPVVTQFSGLQSHIATGDACVVAPMSANFLAKLIAGHCGHPGLALALSYGGTKRPKVFVPTMHESMAMAEVTMENLALLERQGWQQIGPRLEEGKWKLPDPVDLANDLAHKINRQDHQALVTMGGNSNPIDSVRSISNYSSGGLGTAITTELYRRGWQVDVLCGTAAQQPKGYRQLIAGESFDQMAAALKALDQAHSYDAVVFAAAVSDYQPSQPDQGKIRSGQDKLAIQLKPTAKLLEQVAPGKKDQPKIGFKLEPGQVTLEDATRIGGEYCDRYQLSMLVLNGKADVSAVHHKAYLYEHATGAIQELQGKLAIAQGICDHIQRLTHH